MRGHFLEGAYLRARLFERRLLKEARIWGIRSFEDCARLFYSNVLVLVETLSRGNELLFIDSETLQRQSSEILAAHQFLHQAGSGNLPPFLRGGGVAQRIRRRT